MGSGKFGAPRGWRTHEGQDNECVPGQDVLAPITGKLVRVVYPYGKDSPYRGVLIQAPHVMVKVMYIEPDTSLVGKRVEEGQVIGKAQDISQKYGGGMKPHVHWSVIVDPEYMLRMRESLKSKPTPF